jgi:hypothetical protein
MQSACSQVSGRGAGGLSIAPKSGQRSQATGPLASGAHLAPPAGLPQGPRAGRASCWQPSDGCRSRPPGVADDLEVEAEVVLHGRAAQVGLRRGGLGPQLVPAGAKHQPVDGQAAVLLVRLGCRRSAGAAASAAGAVGAAGEAQQPAQQAQQAPGPLAPPPPRAPAEPASGQAGAAAPRGWRWPAAPRRARGTRQSR